MGGVQLCTFEYIELLKNAGFNIILFPVQYTTNLFLKLKIKAGIEIYTKFEFKKIAKSLIIKIKEGNVRYVALNQVDYLNLASYIKNEFNDKVKIILLSHGNESGDFLHKIVRRGEVKFLIRFRDIFRLGALIYTESKVFINYIDLVVSLSETEFQINNWLGAKSSIFIPRTFNPSFVEWKPDIAKIGFLGTLNHKPNLDGILTLCNELKKTNYQNIQVIILGQPEKEGYEIQEKFSFVKYLGYLDETQLRTEVSTWSFFLNPVFWYSRGASTKLAQGVNWGIPVISTIQGNRGYSWSKGEILTAKSPSDMAHLIIKYLQSRDELEILKDNVRLVATHGPDLAGLGIKIKDILSL